MTLSHYLSEEVSDSPACVCSTFAKLINNLTAIPLKNVQAKVDYLHNKSINVYDAPYGNKVAEIPNGEIITLIGKLNDNDEITWYQVGRKKYITSNYIQIEYPEDDE